MAGCCGGGKYTHGAAGIAKAIVGVDRTPTAVRRERAIACFGITGQVPPCDRLRWGTVCSACDCIVEAKIRVAQEECPLGKWSRIPRIASPPPTSRSPTPRVLQPPSM